MSDRELAAELQRTRAALEKATQKSEAFAHLSHEVRTLLNGVIGITQLLLDTELSVEQRDYAKRIRSSGDALLGLINNVLDFSRIEAQGVEVERVDFDLRRVIDEVGELMAERAAVKGIELVVAVPSTVPPAVRGDPAMVRQVLLNLVSNAIKFTDQGEVVLRVVSVHEGPDGVLVRFEVSDTGVGISAGGQAKLFQPFSQVHDSSRDQGGSGLGLALVKRLVEAMEGTIGVRSEAGLGTSFRFSARFERRTPTVDRNSIPRVDVQGRRVLVVAPNEHNRESLKEMIEILRVECSLAADGETALWLLREGVRKECPIDVVLVDAAVPPVASGPLVRAITEDERLSGTQVVVMSYPGQRADGGDARDAESVPSSASAVRARLAKPVQKSRLHACLFRLMGSAVETVGTTTREHETPPPSAGLRRRGATPLGMRWSEGPRSGESSRRIDPTAPHASHASHASEAPPPSTHAERERARARAMADASRRVETPRPSTGRPRILLVEDNAVNQKIAVVMAQKRGYDVDVVENGYDAIAATARSSYVAVLMDCQMPKLDGYSATMQIREREIPGRRLPIIAMTASAGPGAREKCLASGMDDFLSKPMLAEDLDRVLRAWAPLTQPDPAPSPGRRAPSMIPVAPEPTGPVRRASVIDRTMLARLRSVRHEGEPDLVLEVIDLFLTESTERFTSLRDAVDRHDLAVIARVAHTLRGSAAHLGAKALTTLCGRLEDKARTGAPFNGPFAISAIEEELGRVRDALTVEARRLRAAEGGAPPGGAGAPKSRSFRGDG